MKRLKFDTLADLIEWANRQSTGDLLGTKLKTGPLNGLYLQVEGRIARVQSQADMPASSFMFFKKQAE